MMLFKYPAVVVSYDGNTRLANIKLEPLDDGADTMLEAELLYPLGDKSNTAIEVLANDAVWVEFEAGDPRYPIIVGYRNKRTGNDDLTRRYHHANIELLADNLIKIKGDVKVIVEAATIEMTATTIKIDGDVTVKGDVTVTSGDVTADGISLKTHTHPYTDDGSGMTTSPPS
jgi:hypothetical protein